MSLRPASTNPITSPVNSYTVSKRINLIRENFKKIEDLYKHEHNALQAQHDEEVERTKDHEDDDDFNYTYASDLQTVEECFVRSNRVSTLLLCYSFIESVMKDVCLIKKEQMKITLSESDLKGNGIFRSETYLEKVAKIDISNPGINGTWVHLKRLNKIRNYLSHAEGNVKKIDRGDFNKEVNLTSGGVTIDRYGLIHITEKYVEESIDRAENFILYLLKQ